MFYNVYSSLYAEQILELIESFKQADEIYDPSFNYPEECESVEEYLERVL